jgi:hypothetical protein
VARPTAIGHAGSPDLEGAVVNARTLAQGLAAGRIALGLAMFLAPTQASRQWLGPDAERPGTTIAVRALGARDVVLGVGTLAALRDDRRGASPWIEGGIVADGADAVASLLSKSPAAGRVMGVGVASAAAATGIWVRGRLS